MGMSVFMNNDTEPVFGSNSTDIYQNGDWVCENVAQTVNTERLSDGYCENLDVRAFLGMKALMTGFQIGVDGSVDAVNVFAYPSANGNAIALFIEYVHHTWF
jgi:hypothetical protein